LRCEITGHAVPIQAGDQITSASSVNAATTRSAGQTSTASS
jgi:hypothetical protein